MHKFDITLLVLSRPSSLASIQLMRLFEHFTAIGLNCKVSTAAFEVSGARPMLRPHVIVVDGTDNETQDSCAIASALRDERGAFVVLLLDNEERSFEAFSPPLNVDLCFSIRTNHVLMAEEILAALYDGPAYVDEDDVESHRRQPPSPSSNPYRKSFWGFKDDGRTLVAPTGEAVALTRVERKLMRRFLKSPSKVITSKEFDDSSLYPGHGLNGQSLRSVVASLRRKFREAGTSVPIYSYQGEGYFFRGGRFIRRKLLRINDHGASRHLFQ